MEEADPLSELGNWKDDLAYPNYQISSTGAFMNKRTLKIRKQVLHKESAEPSVTLYRFGKGDVLSVDWLLKVHFGMDATLPEVIYKNNKITEVTLPEPKKTKKKETKLHNRKH